MLAQSSDANLKALAARELAVPDKAMSQVTLADDWWTVGEGALGSAKGAIQSHAVVWYRKALPELNGLTKARVDKRIAAARLAGAEEGELLPMMIGKFTPGENGIVILHRGDRIKTPETFSPPVVFRIIAQMRSEGITVLLVEQNVRMGLEVADHAYVLDDGHVVYSGPARELAADETTVQSLAGASAEEWKAPSR